MAKHSELFSYFQLSCPLGSCFLCVSVLINNIYIYIYIHPLEQGHFS